MSSKNQASDRKKNEPVEKTFTASEENCEIKKENIVSEECENTAGAEKVKSATDFVVVEDKDGDSAHTEKESESVLTEKVSANPVADKKDKTASKEEKTETDTSSETVEEKVRFSPIFIPDYILPILMCLLFATASLFTLWDCLTPYGGNPTYITEGLFILVFLVVALPVSFPPPYNVLMIAAMLLIVVLCVWRYVKRRHNKRPIPPSLAFVRALRGWFATTYFSLLVTHLLALASPFNVCISVILIGAFIYLLYFTFSAPEYIPRKRILSALRNFGIYAAGVAVVTYGFMSYARNYSANIPEEDRISSVSFYVSEDDFWGGSHHTTAMQEDLAIDAIRNIHGGLLINAPAIQDRSKYNNIHINIEYRLKDGKILSRKYPLFRENQSTTISGRLYRTGLKSCRDAAYFLEKARRNTQWDFNGYASPEERILKLDSQRVESVVFVQDNYPTVIPETVPAMLNVFSFNEAIKFVEALKNDTAAMSSYPVDSNSAFDVYILMKDKSGAEDIHLTINLDNTFTKLDNFMQSSPQYEAYVSALKAL